MDEIIKVVIQKLQKREQQILTIDFSDDHAFNSSCFLDYKNIHVHSLPLLMLNKLINFEECEFVNWIVEGITYDVTFHFYISKAMCALVPMELITKWPIHIYDNQNRKIQAISQKAITYRDMAFLAENSILFLMPSQLITDLAYEMVEKKQIKLIERF